MGIVMTEWHPLRPLDLGNSVQWDELDTEAIERAKSASSATMPSLDHLKLSDFEAVYEPSDDTYLLLDALAFDHTQKQFDRASMALEIGCGSGVVSVFVRQLCAAPGRQLLSLATDVNRKALQVTQQTAAANSVNGGLELVQCDLIRPLLPLLTGCVDILIFNPPYVPTPDDEVGGAGIEASWAGGQDGRRVVDRAIQPMADLLSNDGVGYLITVDDNRPEELASLFHRSGVEMRPFFRRRAHNEYLTVQKLTKVQGD